MAKESVKKEEPKLIRKTLAQLFAEPCAVAMDRSLMHQSFHVPGGGQETTMSPERPGMKELKMVFHPGYGLIGFHKGKYFLTPSANVIVAHE